MTLRLSTPISAEIKLQLLLYPALQAIDLQTPAHQEASLDPLDYRAHISQLWVQYATGHTRYVAEMLSNDHLSSSAKSELYTKYVDHTFLPPKLFPYSYTSPGGNKPDTTQNTLIWNELKGVLSDPQFTVLLSSDSQTQKLPKAYILTCHQDFLRDDGFFYARKLQIAGVEVNHVHLPHGVHGILNMLFLEEARRANDAIVQYWCFIIIHDRPT